MILNKLSCDVQRISFEDIIKALSTVRVYIFEKGKFTNAQENSLETK